MKMKKRMTQIIKYTFLCLCALTVLLPILYTVTNSLMDSNEIMHYYGGLSVNAAGANNRFIPFHILPDKLSLDGYYQVLLRRPDYLMKFWISLALTGSIVAGQVVISCLAGYGFSKFRFPCRNVVFIVVVILMMMPYQVTLVSNYIILDQMNLIGTYLAVLLPGIFSPFGVFLMKQVMDGIPSEMMESAKLDGANQLQILRRIIVPCSKSGLISLLILSFVDNWNMVEQPLVFLKDQTMYPLSIFLAQISTTDLSVSFSCGILAMIPVALLFAFFEEELVQGISLSNFK